METEYMPWQSALDNLHYYYLMLDRTEVYQPMQVQDIICECLWQRLKFRFRRIFFSTWQQSSSWTLQSDPLLSVCPLVAIRRQSIVYRQTSVLYSPVCNTFRTTWRSWWLPSSYILRIWHLTGPVFQTDTLTSEYTHPDTRCNTHRTKKHWNYIKN